MYAPRNCSVARRPLTYCIGSCSVVLSRLPPAGCCLGSDDAADDDDDDDVDDGRLKWSWCPDTDRSMPRRPCTLVCAVVELTTTAWWWRRDASSLSSSASVDRERSSASRWFAGVDVQLANSYIVVSWFAFAFEITRYSLQHRAILCTIQCWSCNHISLV